MRSDSTPQEISAQARALITEQQAPQKIVIENSLLNTALRTYPDLGEQLITSNYIRLKSFPEPVRPSIKNWISDYTFNLGFGEHTSMMRGEYLFKNDNARVLGFQDKERLSYILKAMDENTPVEINITTKQVIFPQIQRPENVKQEKRTAPRQDYIQNRQVAPTNFSAPSFRNDLSNNIPASPEKKDEDRLPTANIQFSSHQTLPFERTQTPQVPAQTRLVPPAPIRPEEPRRPQPLRINPILNGKNSNENSQLPRNVVNLKK
jgi:hypothetical protein